MLIHIGYHKTASTFLQLRVFNAPRFGFDLFPILEVLPLLVAPHPLGYVPADVRATLSSWRARVASNGLVPVLSHERLSGYPGSGGFDSVDLAGRLQAACPDAKVLIVVREQEGMLRSFYKQYVRDGGVLTLRQLLTQQPVPAAARRVPGFSLDFFRYDRLVECYQGLFGRDRVLVLPFERFQRQPVAFVTDLQRHADVAAQAVTPAPGDLASVNPRLPNSAIAFQRWVNRAFRRNDLNPAPRLWGIPRLGHGRQRYRVVMSALTPRGWDQAAERRQAQLIREVIGMHYAGSNRRLAEVTGLDLGALGYRMD